MTTTPFDSVQDLGLPIRLVILCFVLTILDLALRCIAAYKAWTRRQVARFVCIFLLNTCGILPIIYLIVNKENNKIN